MNKENLFMSKPLEEMTVQELRKYMFDHRGNPQEWEKAFELFDRKAEWKSVPAGATLEEEKQIIKDLIAKRLKK
jgi:hypothetical protein